MSTMGQAAGVGRPRDPAIDRRVLDAALEIFGDSGWSGLTMEAVARRASVGKPAVYRRWADKGALMAEAFDGIRHEVVINSGSFESDVLALGQRLADDYLGPYGPALIRLAVEAKFTSDLGRRYPEMIRGIVVDSTVIVRRAIERGEVPADVDPRLVISMIHGPLLDAVLFTREPTRSDARDYLLRFVDALTSAVISAFRL